MRTHNVLWHVRAVKPSDAFESADLERLASLAKVDGRRRGALKRRLGRAGVTYLLWFHFLGARPTPAQLESHIKRMRDTAQKLQRLMFGVDDKDRKGLQVLDIEVMPDDLLSCLRDAMNDLIRAKQFESPPGFPKTFQALNDPEITRADLGGHTHVSDFLEGLRRMIAATDQSLSVIAAERSKRGRPSAQRGYTVETDIVDTAFELYQRYGKPYSGKSGGCGYAPFAEAVLCAMRRKEPGLKPLVRKTIQDRLTAFRRRPSDATKLLVPAHLMD